jgi:GT2 family glycosyltransferase
MTPQPTLRQALRSQGNAYDPVTADFEKRAGLRWHDPTPPGLGAADLSVVIPARDMSYCLPAALDAIAAQRAAGSTQVIVVDDASSDGTAEIARRHPLRPVVARLPRHAGAAAARNAGTALAGAATIVYADADMILPPHALADIAARARDDVVLLGFRHNLPYQPPAAGRLVVPGWPADLAADHRVRWRAPAGAMIHTGITLASPADAWPLDDTRDLRDLGFARTYLDWDLPRMVVTAALAVPRQAVRDAGGFDPRFGQLGWGSEDTHLGAALIAAGLLVIPLRQLTGYHAGPPGEAAAWQAKLATWPATAAYYQHLLDQPAPHGRARQFDRDTAALLAGCEVTR